MILTSRTSSISLANVLRVATRTLHGGQYAEKRQDYAHRGKFKHPYQNMFNWKSLTEFCNHLEANIVYYDKHLLAINKPWGVGIYTVNPKITEKTNYQLYSEAFGDPQFCIDQALDELGDRLNVKNLKLIRTLDRYESGLILLSTDERTANLVKKGPGRMRSGKKPFTSYLCICKGWMQNPKLSERVGVTLKAIDEDGEYKEPEIINNPSKRSIQTKAIKPTWVTAETFDTNRQLAVSLMEIGTMVTKWKFVQCYAASKTTFILGDVRFAKRVRSVMGIPIKLTPQNINAYDEFEPLPQRIRSRLGVLRNNAVPLMMHHWSYTIPGYRGAKTDLVLTCDPPDYFSWTMDQLELKLPKDRNQKSEPLIDVKLDSREDIRREVKHNVESSQ